MLPDQNVNQLSPNRPKLGTTCFLDVGSATFNCAFIDFIFSAFRRTP